jgi:hypothetical protein
MGLAASYVAWGADPTLSAFYQAATVRPRNLIEAATPPIDTADWSALLKPADHALSACCWAAV